MKLAVCARSEGLKAEVDERFGRSPYFVIVDTENEQVISSVRNTNADASGGAGPQSAQLLSEHDVEAIAVGNVGPNAATALEAAKIKIYTGLEGTVSTTVQKFKEGKMTPITGATVSSHSGMRR